MRRGQLRFFDERSEPLAARVAEALNKLGLALKHHSWRQANQEGLSPTQGQILAVLAGGGPLRPSEVARRLGLTLPTVSDSVRVLVDKALVLKTPDADDGRAARLRLTAAGRRSAARTAGWPELLAGAVDTLSAAEQEAFLSGLMKMIRALQESGLMPASRMCVTCTHFRPAVHAGDRPHHCAFVDAPMAARHLRIDCAEHEAADAAAAAAIWARFVGGRGPAKGERR